VRDKVNRLPADDGRQSGTLNEVGIFRAWDRADLGTLPCPSSTSLDLAAELGANMSTFDGFVKELPQITGKSTVRSG
jgi:hypothetical protein